MDTKESRVARLAAEKSVMGARSTVTSFFADHEWHHSAIHEINSSSLLVLGFDAGLG